MKFIFNRSTVLMVLLFFLINNSIIAKTIDFVSLSSKTKPTSVLHDTTKQIVQSAFLLRNNIVNHSIIDIQNNSLTKGKFELGVEFGLFRTCIEYLFSYKTFGRGSQRFSYKTHQSTMGGLSLARQLNQKIWLQTGIRYGRSTWSNYIFFDALYNKSREQISPNGEIYNDLTLISSGQLNESEININVLISNVSSLDDGDVIVSNLLVEKQLNWLQIPIGLTYRFGKKQLNYEIQGGLSLNQIAISNYNVEGFIEGQIAVLAINEITYPKKDNKRFIEAYLGTGIRYNIKENIVLNTNFNLRYAPSIQVFSDDIFTDWHFGVNYLF